MYDIVKNDPHYMKRNYKANAQMIQNIFEDRECDNLLRQNGS